jgi:pimeloyl-ACP methyl ester carboxylesterase
MRALSPGFGPHTDDEWLALSRPMLRPLAQGGWRLHYDPAIAVAYAAITEAAAAEGEQTLWRLYDQVTAQTLVLRGADSDLLSRDTAAQMAERGPHAQCVEWAGVGHAPTLIAPEQLAVVLNFLLP